jgi:hypothetical protein
LWRLGKRGKLAYILSSSSLREAAHMNDQQPYRMIIRHSNALADLRAFADDVGCRVTKDDEEKTFVFCKRE